MMVGLQESYITEEFRRMIAEDKIGGVILFKRNIKSAVQLRALTEKLQEIAKESGHIKPLLIATDQENGSVNRLGGIAERFPGNMALGTIDDPEMTYRVSLATGRMLKQFGINMNLAPVLDCNSNPENPVIGVRAFSDKAEEVALHGIEYIKGHQAAGVVASGKHFPGHGDTSQDSHYEMPVVSKTYEQLMETEFLPFIAAIRHNIPSLMINHVHYPAIEKEGAIPATVSRKVITGILREELNYEGLIITDCLEMNAVSRNPGTPQAALQALKAGVDMVMVSHSSKIQAETIDNIEKAVLAGEIDMGLIETALDRIRRVKEDYLTWTDRQQESLSDEEIAEYRILAQSAYAQGIKTVKPFSPISGTGYSHIHIIWMLDSNTLIVEDRETNLRPLSIEMFSNLFPHVSFTEQNVNKDHLPDSLATEATDAVLIFTDYQQADPVTRTAVQKIIERNRVTVIAMKYPHILSHFKDADGLAAIFEDSEQAITAFLTQLLHPQTKTEQHYGI